MTRAERRKQIEGEHELEAAAEAKRKQCRHYDAVSVDNDVLGRVAWWCEECETQLPPEFQPPKRVDVTTDQLRDMTVDDYKRLRSEQGYILYKTATDQVRPDLTGYRKGATQRIWDHHVVEEKGRAKYEADAKANNAAYFEHLAQTVPGWTVQQHTECPPDEMLSSR